VESGFIVSYHSDGEPLEVDLPGALLPDSSLDDRLDQISAALRAWILKEQSQFRSLNISICGPIEGAANPRRSPEERLADATTQEERFYALGDAAKNRYDAADYEVARR